MFLKALPAARRAAPVSSLLPVVAAVILAAGCSGVPFFHGPSSTPTAPASAPAATAAGDAVRPAAAGFEIVLHDPQGGTDETVTLGEPYVAASGSRCGKYYELGTYLTGARPLGVACVTGNGDWVRIPVTVHNGFAE